jgi:ribosomal protein S18 acetylase RimI-like enzyme
MRFLAQARSCGDAGRLTSGSGCEDRAVSAERIRIVDAGAGDLGRVEPLWRSMVEFHRQLAGSEWPVRTAREAWQLRSAQYRDWLAGEACWLLLATGPGDQDEPSGYAMLRLVEPGPTWDLGERVGEIESLAVARDARGKGVGSALIDAARQRLREQGISHWSVAVVETNEGATRLYRRHGFRNYYRQLLAPVDPDGPGPGPEGA